MKLPRKTRVIELASVLAGPSVGMFFAELGAEVIKVETPTGDVTRTWKLKTESTENDRPAYFCAVNWGKKSVVIDLNQSEGQQQLHGLLQAADILLTSFKPGDAHRFKLAWPSLHEKYPNLISGEISGYGSHDQRVGYDAIIQAEAGFMALNGEPGNTFKMPVALVDVLAAHQLKEGLLLALWQREIDGIGRRVEVSLVQSAIAALVNQGTNYLVGGVEPAPMGNEHPNIVPYGRPYITADAVPLVLAVGTDQQFESLCKILNIALPESLRHNQSRVQRRDEVNALLTAAISRVSSTWFTQALEKSKIPFGRINRMSEVAALPAAKSLEIQAEGLRSWRSAVFSLGESQLTPPPHLGEHQAILTELK